MTILPTENGDVYGYEGYAAMIARNNDFHNTTDCITIDGYHPDHRELVVSVGTLPAQPAYKILQGIDEVYDVIETNQSQAKGKYFVLYDRAKRRETERTIHKVLKAITLRITNACDMAAEKQYKQCSSLRSRLSQGGYRIQAAELHKEIYNHKTLLKSYTTKPYFDMTGFTLDNDNILTPPAAAAPTQNASKPTNPPTHQALLLGNPSPRQHDDRSITSNTDNVSLANTFATFETNLTAAITTIFELQNNQRAVERKDAVDAEARREEQRR